MFVAKPGQGKAHQNHKFKNDFQRILGEKAFLRGKGKGKGKGEMEMKKNEFERTCKSQREAYDKFGGRR